MKFKKGGVYSVRLSNEECLYIYYITGGDVGDLVKVVVGCSDEIEEDVTRIVEGRSLYAGEYVIAFLDADRERMSLVGEVRVDFRKLMDESFFTRRSIKCGIIKESFNGDVNELRSRFELGQRFYFDDWRLEEHKIIGPRGKFDVVREHYVGRLPEEYLGCFNSMIFPNIDDFFQMYNEGIDRNTMLSIVYQ